MSVRTDLIEDMYGVRNVIVRDNGEVVVELIENVVLEESWMNKIGERGLTVRAMKTGHRTRRGEGTELILE